MIFEKAFLVVQNFQKQILKSAEKHLLNLGSLEKRTVFLNQNIFRLALFRVSTRELIEKEKRVVLYIIISFIEKICNKKRKKRASDWLLKRQTDL